MVETYALVRGGVVVEIVRLPDGSPPLQHLFHPSVIAQLHRLTDAQAETVQVDWLSDAGVFTAPPPPPVPPTPIAYVSASLARERLEADGFWDEFSAILASNPAAMLKVLTLRDGIDPSDPDAIALIGASGASPERVLSPPGTVLEPLTPPTEP